MTQYVGCQFGGRGSIYTYHNDGAPVAVGDKVAVETRDGRQTVVVAEIREDRPPFDTKPVLGKVTDDVIGAGDEAAA